MASLVRQKQKLTVGVLVLAAVAAASVGFSQPVLEPAEDRQRQVVERIEQEQARNGPHSEDLIGSWSALGLLRQEDGDHELAAAAFERAREIVRVNYGFRSLEEAPLLRQLVRIEEARGNVETAWGLEDELLDLVRQHPSDVRIAPILREIADKRMDILERYRAGEFPPQIILGCYYRGPRNPSCTSGSRREVIGRISFQAQWYRATAIEAILRNGLYASDELRELEMDSLSARGMALGYPCPPLEFQELLEMELIGSCLEPVISQEAFADVRGERLPGIPVVNIGGTASLARLLIYEVRSSAPALSQVNALVRLADFRLAALRAADVDESTLALYEHAYRQLEENGIAQASIEEIFSPQTPVVITSGPNPLVFEETQESTRYIDVAFDITKHGESENIEILDATTDATRGAEKDLVRLIERSRFRPRVTDGQFSDTSQVLVRYYLND
jgi:tetratricopeptide (TPR) repeat protein